MDFKEHFEAAWKLTVKFIMPLILLTLVLFMVGFVTFGIMAPVAMAGYMHSLLLLLKKGREPKMQDIFSEMRLFLPLLVFGLAVFIVTLIGFTLLVLPGILVILFIAFSCLYVLPLMTDKKIGLIEAVKESYRLSVQGNIVDQIVTVILFLGITVIGSSVFIGWLFTQPLATIFLLSVYTEKTSSLVQDSDL